MLALITFILMCMVYYLGWRYMGGPAEPKSVFTIEVGLFISICLMLLLIFLVQ
jgi:hypothetical protein